MTLLIACMIIAGLELPPILYFISCAVWILHLCAHSDSECKVCKKREKSFSDY